uniref:non-specific serine/threonine protein kinase n=1 Tax=Manihot esculenta TaxID=3983 RepID=A0A2C9USJ2_MANES
MGNCWWCSPAPKPTPDHPTNIHDVGADENVYDSNGYSATSTNLTTWVSQSSSSFTTIWGNNATEQIEAFTNGPSIAYSNLRAFTYAQLKAATHNFRRDMVVGKGGFGSVYKGWLKEKMMPRGIKKTAIAIKILSPASAQGAKEWKAEVSLLGSLSHPNLVKLLGYCQEDGNFVLVYEFMKRGSLNRHLFGKRSVQPLPWNTRLKLAIGAARGLDYLHSLENPIIYRDFKSSNILLDEFYEAKIADFGLAFFGPLTENSHVTTRIMGTFGYADPEYIATE